MKKGMRWLLTLIVVVTLSFPVLASTEKQILYHHAIYQFLTQQPQGEYSLYEEVLLGFSFLALGESSIKQIQKCLTIQEPFAGSNLWLALFLLQYQRLTDDDQFQAQALKICDWFCQLPQYQGLPVMSDESTEENIPWNQIVSIEDAKIGIVALKLAALLVPDATQYRERANIIQKSLKKWGHLPPNSFLLMGMAADSAKPLQAYLMTSTVYLVSDRVLPGIEQANNIWDFLGAYGSRLEKEPGSAREKRAHYNNLRTVVNALNLFLDWQKNNCVKVYDQSSSALLQTQEEWYYPESSKEAWVAQGITNVCFDLFRREWNPLDLKNHPLKQAKKESYQEHSLELSESARFHLMAGHIDKAEEMAYACVDRYEASGSHEEAVVASWLILGKIYHDRSEEAADSLKFSSAQDLQKKRNRAFQEIESRYPTASITHSRSGMKKVFQIIKSIYN